MLSQPHFLLHAVKGTCVLHELHFKCYLWGADHADSVDFKSPQILLKAFYLVIM